MKRIAKTLLIILGVIVVAFVALVVALPMLIDPNDYKEQIVKVVKDKTGRDLTIDGKIGLSFFPWLGVEMNRLRLSNAAGFGDEPFAQIDHAGVKVKLLPLLRKQVEVDRVILNKLDLNLAVDAQGKSNWADLTAPKDAPAATPESAPAGGPPAIAALSVNGLDVKNGRVRYRDAQAGSDSTFDNIEIRTGALADGRETDVKIGFDLLNKPATASTQGKQQQAAAQPLRARVDIDSKVQLNMAKETLNLRDLTLKLADLKLKATLEGQKLFSAPAFSGHIELAPFNAREVLAKLGTRLQTQDPNALAKASLSTDLKSGADGLSLTKFSAQVDDSRLNGQFSLTDFAKPAYRFDLALDRIDLDRYLAPTAADAKAPADKPAPAAKPTPAVGTANPAAPAVALPLETLRALNADGRVRIGQLKAFAIRSSDVLIQLKAKNGLINLGPTQAKLYGGSYNGAMTYDARGNTPTLTMDENLKNIQVGGFLKDTYNFDKFTGVGNIVLKVNGRGLTAEDIKSTLAGNGSFAIDNGVLKGIDIRKMGGQIEDAVKTRRIDGLADLAPTPTDETKFTALRATTKVQNGVASNDDLDLQGAGLKVSGKGSASLPAATVDYVAMINGFPVKISGPFAHLKYRPDWNAILKAQTGARVEQEKQKLRERGGEAEQKARDKLDQKLKDFLQKRK